jgi:hypothetical protein
MTTELRPDIDSINEPYWNGIAQGTLQYQACRCGHSWLPPRALCPACLGDEWQWMRSTGRGELISWVVYYVAYHPEFKDRLPYNVAIVELAEGPRLITNILDKNEDLVVGAQVELHIDRTREVPLAQFRIRK